MGEPIQDDATNGPYEDRPLPEEVGRPEGTGGQDPSTHASGTGIPSADEAAETGEQADDFLQEEPGPPDPPD